MQWSDEVDAQIRALDAVKINEPLLQRIVSVMDLTSLSDADDESSIAFFSEKARTPVGDVAAICIHRRFVKMMAAQFAGSKVKVATVVNFPEGDAPIETVLIEMNDALEAGAQEIDVVFPYKRFLAGETHFAGDFVSACKAAIGDKALLKVILETGVYTNEDQIVSACETAILGGADFIKTSTGKLAQGASLHAAAAMLLVIMQLRPGSDHEIGLKVAGGIRSVSQAAQYLQLADNIMGKNWVKPSTFRIGASKLVDEIAKLV